MHFVFLDDSICFDGNTPNVQALGGAEKALVGLTEALAACGYQVTVGNRCTSVCTISGVTWCPLEVIGNVIDLPVDVEIAFRAPSLLGRIPAARHRFLWATAHPDYLKDPRVSRLLAHHCADVLVSSLHQATLWSGDLPAHLLPLGVRSIFLEMAQRRRKELAPLPDPIVVTTLHPEHNLGPLLDIWMNDIYPRLPKARLVIMSSGLSASNLEGRSPQMQDLFQRVQGLTHQGVEVSFPGSDQDMVAMWQQARVHLYPLADHNVCCWTLAEGQACGVPAVAFSAGGALDCIDNGTSGYCVPDHQAMANVTGHILENDNIFRQLSQGACALGHIRSWKEAALSLATLCDVRCIPETACTV